jgi:hypothetical protein
LPIDALQHEEMLTVRRDVVVAEPDAARNGPSNGWFRDVMAKDGEVDTAAAIIDR